MFFGGFFTDRCAEILNIVVSDFNYLAVLLSVLLVVELQDPDGGNDTDEKQKNCGRKPAKKGKSVYRYCSKLMKSFNMDENEVCVYY